MASQESSAAGSIVAGHVCGVPAAPFAAAGQRAEAGRLIATISAPPPFKKALRVNFSCSNEVMLRLLTGSGGRFGGTLDCTHDRVVGGAATEVRVHPLLD